ncbi:hypothetical protein E3N88_15803 [Mikania micrantha]|uniref:Protein kinase domain-containing protein n=1 Tax=Mikania micrantha TaxID=192012 RepID=A0A5N6NYP6_9ASTR|nr:hypothetical protein E3N88_15803 [Mikania micrantha]
MLTTASSDRNDITNLITFKASLNNTRALANWDPDIAPCNMDKENWNGIICGKDGRVFGLRLENMGLTGTIDMDTLSKLSGIRTLSLANNSLWARCQMDDMFAGMDAMRRIELQNNKFTGRVPGSLTGLSILVDLQMQDNEFEGELPDFEQESLKMNFANNRLSGRIPPGLKNQDPSSFAGNNLCGHPVTTPCKITNNKHTRKTLVITIVAVLAIIFIVLLVFHTRKTPKNDYKNHQTTKLNRNNPYKTSTKGLQMQNDDEDNYKRARTSGDVEFVRSDRERFGLQDLLRASADVLGGGSFGSSYKAVVLGGTAVVVKRFREMNSVRKEEFYVHMTRLGRFSHPNLLPLVAFYYKKDEKLLIMDFAENGSLASHLYVKRKGKEPGLDWPTRLKIIKGVTQGLAYLYNELPHLSLPHGHLKSSNVLLDNAFNPLLADYALSPLVNKHHAQDFMVAYKSPEFTYHDRTTTKTDVWCLGILILEVLTGKFPANYLKQGKGGSSDLETWVNSVVREEWTGEVFDKDMNWVKNCEGEMLKLLKIGMCCCEWDVDRRWELSVAVAEIGKLTERGGDDEWLSCTSEGDACSSNGVNDFE